MTCKGKGGEGRAGQQRGGQGNGGEGMARQGRAGQEKGRARDGRAGQGTVGQGLLYLKACKGIATLIICHLHLTIALLSNGGKEEPLGVHMGCPYLHSIHQVLYGQEIPA